ncbi:imidazole glycerol phosphate synthase subunit HisH [Candidatus Sumerlaeota bacterium]|nr:imidazole glycerol phosphate synthase subunit HisH [Candidatus Sumerlaeota bacterium]
MIAVIDYGMGNVRSVVKAFASLGYEVSITCSPKVIERASHVVLPGVGAFGDAMQELNNRNLTGAIRDTARDGTPFLGICIGLQVLFDSSEENPGVPGLGLIPGTVKRFQPADPELKVPHMGWNRLTFVRRPPLAEGLAENPFVYFVHSFYTAPADEAVTAATTEYDVTFTSMIWRDNMFATQFHPEKSQATGLQMLKNFAELKI